jgi:PAS domain S-box-containing protein
MVEGERRPLSADAPPEGDWWSPPLDGRAPGSVEAGVHHAALGIAHVSPEGRFLFVNRKLCEISGYSEAELLERTFLDITHASDLDVSRLEQQRLIAGEQSDYYVEKRYVRRDGSSVWAGVTVSAVRERGEFRYSIGIVQDITERKEGEDRLALQYLIARILSECVTLPQATTRLLASLGDALGSESTALWSADAAARTLTCVDAWHAAPGSRFVRRRGEVLRGKDEPALGALRDGAPVWGPETFAVPVRRQHEILGVIESRGHGARPKSPAWRALIGVIADQLGQFMTRVQTEQALRDSEARHRAVLDASLDAIVTIDHLGIVREWNPAAVTIFGYSRDAAVGKALADLIVPPRLAGRHREGLRRYVETGEGEVIGKRVRLPAIRAGGAEFPAEISITRIGTGDPPMFTGHIRDITDRDRAERALRESEERLRTLVNASPEDPIQMKDGEGRWLEANEAGLRLFGACGIEYRGKTDAELASLVGGAPARALAGCIETDEIAWQRGSTSRVEETLRTPEGDVRVYDVIKVPIFGANQERRELVILARDITAQKAVEAEKVKVYEDALRARDEFLSIASHELRTPATSLSLAVQALTRLAGVGSLKDAPEPLLRKFLDTCSRQTKQLGLLIDRLLDVGRIHTGGLHLELEAVDMTALVKETLASMSEELMRADCATTLSERGPVVGRWDRARLIEVLYNLLSNAIKYAAGKPIDVSVAEDTGRALVVVRDYGIGIDVGQQEAVFEKFGRAVSGREYAGMGLGLYVVREIVRAHGGRILLDSKLGAGARFTVELPLEPPAP